MSEILAKEIKNISIATAVMGIIQLIITVPAGYFGYPAALGTLFGCIIAVANFTLMGVILEKCVSGGRGASGLMGFGYIARLALIAVVVIWAMKADYLNYVCVIIPLLFPQIAVFIINFARRKERKADDNERT